jgi:excisionase family DNA binding protein
VPAHDQELLLSPVEVAHILGLGRTSTYKLLWSGAIPSFRLGRSRKIKRTDLDDFIATREQEAARGA